MDIANYMYNAVVPCTEFFIASGSKESWIINTKKLNGIKELKEMKCVHYSSLYYYNTSNCRTPYMSILAIEGLDNSIYYVN